MSPLSWLPFGKKQAVEPAEPSEKRMPGTGPITGCDLNALSSLVQPFAQDPFHRLRPPFSAEAVQRSLELADAAYTLELDPWTEAGWGDVSVLIDDSLHSGLPDGGEGPRAWMSHFRLLRAKRAMKERNPLSQVLSALRQRERSDTIKAVCMMHPLPEGQFLLAIGFMGTGSRFYDWFSNLRFTTEEGFHRGFYQLCDSFEENAEEIQFPSAAAALGLEKLTLGQVLLEMKSLSSRFRLWMAGHSQGGAVMQVLAHRWIHDWGVLSQNMVGYGFASPTVATGKLVYDPAAYPLYHILNSDDLVPRMGALLHLGMCAEYPSDERLREAAYAVDETENDVEAVAMLAPFHAEMADTPSIILQLTGLLQCLVEEKGEEGLSELMNRPWAVPLIDHMLTQAGDRAMDLVDRAVGAMQEGYAAMTGELMKPKLLMRIREEWRPVVRALTVRRLLSALGAYAAPPHRLMMRDGGGGEGAYAWIVNHGMHMLEPFLWVKTNGMPVRRYGEWNRDNRPAAAIRFAARRQLHRKGPQLRGKLRVSYSARRSAAQG